MTPRSRRLLCFALAWPVLVACTTPGPRLRQLAPNTFELSRDGADFVLQGARLKARLLDEALAFCQARGKGLALLDSTATDAEDGRYATSTVRFNCL